MIQRGHPDNARHHRHGTHAACRRPASSVTESEREARFRPQAAAILARRAQVACARFLHTGHRCVAGRAPRNGAPGEPRRRSVDVTTMAITRRGFLRTAVAAGRGAGAPPAAVHADAPRRRRLRAGGRARRIRAVRPDVKLSYRLPAGLPALVGPDVPEDEAWPSLDETMEPLETVDPERYFRIEGPQEGTDSPPGTHVRTVWSTSARKRSGRLGRRSGRTTWRTDAGSTSR